MTGMFENVHRALNSRADFKRASNLFYKSLSAILFIATIVVIVDLKIDHSDSFIWDPSKSHHSSQIIDMTGAFRPHGHRGHMLVRSMVENGESEETVNKMANFFNKMYTGKLEIGTSSQSFKNVVFDTGSADLWVLDANGEGVPHKNYLNYFDSDSSSTYSQGSHWSISYGTGSASGWAGTDTVTISGLTIDSQKFARATNVDDMAISRYEPQDGICGFAMSEASTINGAVTVMESLYNAGLNEDGVFSFYLSAHGDRGSKLIIGYPPDNLISGELTYFPLADYSSAYTVSGLWGIELNQIYVNGQAMSFDSTQYAIMDTGTTYIGVPSSFYKSFMRMVTKMRPDCNTESGSAMDVYLCTDTIRPMSDLPTISFEIADADGNLIKMDLQASDYLDDDGQIGAMSIDADIWILGDSFLSTYVTVFDEPNSRIGMAKSNYHNSFVPDVTRTIIILGSSIAGILLALGITRCWITKKAKSIVEETLA